jgi:hypothetical protein
MAFDANCENIWPQIGLSDCKQAIRRSFNERNLIACDASDNHIKISLYPKRYGALRVVPEVMT